MQTWIDAPKEVEASEPETSRRQDVTIYDQQVGREHGRFATDAMLDNVADTEKVPMLQSELLVNEVGGPYCAGMSDR